MAKHVDVGRRETLWLSLQLFEHTFCLNTAFPSEEAYSVFDGSEAGQGSASRRATGWGEEVGPWLQPQTTVHSGAPDAPSPSALGTLRPSEWPREESARVDAPPIVLHTPGSLRKTRRTHVLTRRKCDTDMFPRCDACAGRPRGGAVDIPRPVAPVEPRAPPAVPHRPRSSPQGDWDLCSRDVIDLFLFTFSLIHPFLI